MDALLAEDVKSRCEEMNSIHVAYARSIFFRLRFQYGELLGRAQLLTKLVYFGMTEINLLGLMCESISYILKY